jgi:hypothetical protein
MLRFVSAACVAVFLLAVGVTARADDQKDLTELIAKAIKVHGGADNIAKQKATVMKGKGKVFIMGDDGIPYTGTWSFQEPDRMRVEIEAEIGGGQTFKFISVVDKDKGWMALGETLQDADKDHMAESREEMHAHRLTQLIGLLDKDCKLSTVGEVKVNDKPAIGVRAECKGFQDVTLFFDKDTSQLVKTERRGKDVDAGQEYKGETIFADYKKVNGVLTAYKHTIKRDGKVYVEHEITEFEVKDKLDDKLFKKP